MGSPLVGRDDELAALDRVLALAASGRGRIVLLSGAAGIGKSRLAAELLATARDRGVTSMEGRAHPLHAGLAYAPIVEAIRAHLATLSDRESAELLGGLTDLGRLLADPRLPDAPPLGDAALERTRMFEAVAQLFVRVAERDPVLLVVEDLHWADRGTVELVHYIGHAAAAQRILVLATYRAGEAEGPLRDLAVAIRRGDPENDLALAPLTDAAVAELTTSLLHGSPTAALLHTVTSRARGIPLFVTALVQGSGREAPDVAVLPAIVRDLVLDRLIRLDDGDRRLLEIVAVAGEAGTTAVLRAVFDAPDFEPTLRRLVVDSLITEQVAGRSMTYRVTHPLYAEVAYAELTLGERRALHAGCAAAIDRLNPDDVLALAPHYREAGTLVDHARAAEVMAAAGWRALSVHAGEEATRYLAAALDGARRPDRSTVELLEGLGRAHLSCGRLDDAVEVWQRGLTLAEQLGDVESMSSLPHWLALTESERGEAPRAAPRLPPTRDPVTTDAEHMLLRTVFLLRHGDEAALREAARELAAFIAIDPAPAAQAAGHLGHTLAAMLDNDFEAARVSAQESLRNGVRCISAAPMLGTWANRDLIALTVLAGDIPGALAHTRHFFDTFGPSVTPPTMCNARYSLALVHYLGGDLDTALDEIDTGITLARRVAMPRALGRTLSCRAFLLAEQGRVGEAQDCLAESQRAHTADEASLIALEELTQTVLAMHAGRPDKAPPFGTRALHEEPVIMSLRLFYATLAKGATVDHLQELGRTAPFLAALADRASGDPVRLQAAAENLDKMGAPLLAAQAWLEWAELADDRQTARDIVVRCLGVFERARIVPWVDRARRLARSLGVRIPVSRKSGELSKREAQIVALVGAGLSNADIAARLFLSERTVETHLRNAYARLGLSSRVALARWAGDNSG